MIEKPFSWTFRRLKRDDMIQDATEAEFFKQDEELPDAVVRELIQNSLDAASPRNTQVTVCFNFSGENHALSPERAQYWFGSLHYYLEFAKKTPAGFLSLPLSYLTVEDFGTRGLEGDPQQQWDTTEKNDFYMFWRNVGRSSKQEGDRGRWGLGKAVNHEASEASSFFGITKRATDGILHLMGRSVLPFPVIKGEAYDPRGWFGWPDTNADGTLTMPVMRTSVINESCSDFNLKREASSGLSLVIPLPKNVLTPLSVTEAVVRNYFHAILSGKLQVKISTIGAPETSISSSTIGGVAQQFVAKEGVRLTKLFDLAKWGHDLPDNKRVLLEEVGVRSPDWTPAVFSSAVELREDLHTKFQAGARLAFRLPISVKRTGNGSIQSSIADVYLERVGGSETNSVTNDRGLTVFVREGMTVPMPRFTHERSVRALLVVDTQPLSSLLGDAENPMHTDWIRTADKLIARNKNGPATVTYVKNAVREITRWLSELEDQKREALLTDIFYIDEPVLGEGEEKDIVERKKKKRRTKRGTKKTPSNPKGPTPYRVSKIAGGFEVTPVDDLTPPTKITVRAAYDARDSDAFESYRPHDFIIGRGGIEVSARGADYMVEFNSIAITVKRRDFRIAVTGFDVRRDLRVEGRRSTGEDESTAGVET